jgi:hypothetical protein
MDILMKIQPFLSYFHEDTLWNQNSNLDHNQKLIFRHNGSLREENKVYLEH